MVLDSGVHTPGITIGDEAFRASGSEKWTRHRATPWFYAFDAERNNIVLGDPQNSTGRILFSPCEFFTSLLRVPADSVTWNPERGHLEARLKRGSRLIVRFRSPTDMKSFGSPIGEVSTLTPEGNYFIHRNIVLGRQLFLRLAEFDRDHLATVLEAEDRRMVREKLDQVLFTQGYLETMFALERMSATRAPDDRAFGMEATRCVRELGVLTYDYRELVNNKEGHQLREFEQQSCSKAAVELQKLASLSARRFEAQGCLFVDDSGLRHLSIERLATFGLTEDLWQVLIKGLLESRHVPIQQKLAVAAAGGDMGMPPLVRLNAVCRDGEYSSLINAVLNCRWGMEPSKEQLELLQALSRSTESPAVRNFAVDCLARWGHVEELSATAIDAWYEAVVQGPSASRDSLWRDLSLTGSGRRLLLEGKGIQKNPEMWSEFRPILRQRAEDALSGSRFEQIPEQECRELLAL